MEGHQPLRQLETSLRLVGAQGRETVRTGPFEVYLSDSENLVMSFATPTVDAPDWSEAIQSLCEVFATRRRRPRLEYFYERYPSLALALEEAGFKQTSAAPVMTLTRDALSSRPTQMCGTYNRLQAHEPEKLKAFLRYQSVAYGGTDGEDSLGWFPQLTEGLKDGTIFSAGLEQEGDFVSGASIQMGGEIGELAGVWTRPDMQRRGFAFAVCQSLLTDYFAAGFELCWLSASEGAEGVYKRLGFEQIGTQLNYYLPEG